MGGGVYSSVARSTRANDSGYYTKSSDQIFTNRSISRDMDPLDIKFRESCDSDEHPESIAIIIALDVTGSMGYIPNNLIKDGLPTMMQKMLDEGVKDPQVLFLGIGDHTCDHAPLQVGQFESSDELMDKWLTDVWLEGHGGGNDAESYLLAWMLAARHTKIDCFDKRNRKGFLFTIGDEPNTRDISENAQTAIFGRGQYKLETAQDLLREAQEKYNVYHVNVCETPSGGRKSVEDGWKQNMSENAIMVQSAEQIPEIIAATVAKANRGEQSVTQSDDSVTGSTDMDDMIL